MAFTFATYNVLASAYVAPSRYPDIPVELLDPSYRTKAVVERVARIATDIVCLQEVEEPLFVALRIRLGELGYIGEWVKKGGSKPDGCATFVQCTTVGWVRSASLHYDDANPGTGSSGHVAQVVAVRVDGQVLAIANTHLKWDPPGLPPERRYGRRQALQLLRARATLAPEGEGWIVCGDMNSLPTGDVVAIMAEVGFDYPQRGRPAAATCIANGRATMIDFLFHDRALVGEPLPQACLAGGISLPNSVEPSDHVVLSAAFSWCPKTEIWVSDRCSYNPVRDSNRGNNFKRIPSVS